MEEFKTRALEYLNNIEVFTKEEAPAYFKEYLLFVKIHEIGWLAFRLLGVALSVYLIHLSLGMTHSHSNNWKDEIAGEMTDTAKWLFVGSVFSSLVFFSISIESIIDLSQVIFSPKVILVRHIKNLVNIDKSQE